MSVANRLKEIQERILDACARVGRDPAQVRLLAVSKTQPVHKIDQAIAAGQTEFAENYAREALEKMEEFSGDVHWHFIGRLQSNKVKMITGKFTLIHSVDRESLLAELNKTPQDILLQFNVAAEGSKGGGDALEVRRMLDFLLRQESVGVRVCGLMVMPPPTHDPESVRPYFRQARELLATLRESLSEGELAQHPLDQLSMGTSQDFEVAVEEGATWIRVGTDVFGPRGNQ